MVIAIIVVAFLLAAGLIALFVTVQVMWHRVYKKTLPNGEERPKQTFKEWIKNHIPTKRRLIQVYAALLYNANIKGFISGDIYQSSTSKYMCVPGLNCYSCPGAVGACPLGAFQNALAESPTRAPYYVLGIIGLFGLMLARTICGFLCPVGLAQDLLYKIRTPKLKKSRVTRVFSYLKYVILAVLVIAIPLAYAVWNMPLPGFCKTICPAGTFGGAILMLVNPSRASMFGNLGPLFTWKFCLMVAIIVAAIFIYRFFCRFFCPLGAIYGFFNRIALLGVKVDKENCIECGKCVAVCKMDVKRVGDHECINCGECIAVCPTKAIRWKGSKLFLRGAAVKEAALEAEIKPINLAGGEIKIEPQVEKPPTAVAENVATEAVQENTGVIQEAVNQSDVITAPAGEEVAERVQEKPKRKKKSLNFWLQLSAWIAALLVLIGALVYYNFVDVDKKVDPSSPPPSSSTDEDIGYHVGQIAPDFTVKIYGSDESFTLSENRGKLTVINFWATWCSGCVREMPHFGTLAGNYPDITVIAIHGSSTADVDKFINDKWPGYAVIFAQDNLDGDTCLTFNMFGGRGDWPITIIVDEEGTVVYNESLEFHSYEQLEGLVTSFMETE